MKSGVNKVAACAARLQREISGKSWGPHDRLPPVRALAKTWNISPVTALRVLDKMVHDGVLKRGAGGRYTPATQTAEFHLERQRPRYAEIADDIRSGIFAGLFERTQLLPSQKSIKAKYCCSDLTARCALDVLRKKGLIARHGRGYRVVAAVKQKGTGSSVFLVGRPGRIRQFFQSHLFGAIAAIELGLMKRQWNPLRVVAEKTAGQALQVPSYEISAFIHLMSPGTQKGWLSKLESTGQIPVVVLDEFDLPVSIFSRSQRVFWISPDNRSAGREVGRFLAGKGHRSIAFLGSEQAQRSTSQFQRLRIDGIREYFGGGIGQGGRSLRVMLGDYAPGRGVVDPRLKEAVQSVATLAARYCPGVGAEIIKEGIRPLRMFYSGLEAGAALKAAFEETLADRHITAWVCTNDTVAAFAHSFLTNQRVRIPQDIALVGFDNSSLSHTLGISSYDFCFEQHGNLAITCIERPAALKCGPDGKLRVPGYLIARQST